MDKITAFIEASLDFLRKILQAVGVIGAGEFDMIGNIGAEVADFGNKANDLLSE